MIIKNNKNKSFRHHTATCFFVLLLVGSFLFGVNAHAALLGTYNKATSSTLTANEWNYLIQDFLSTMGGVVNGPVGIGTSTSASYILNVVGGINGNYGGTLSAANISNGQFGLNTGGGIYSFPGNVGVGTTAPNYTLDVVQTSAGAETIPLHIQNTSGNAGTAVAIGFSPYSSGVITGKISNINRGGMYDLAFSNWDGSGNIEHLRILSNGNVGIGTTNPTAKLTVNGDIGNTGWIYSSNGLVAGTGINIGGGTGDVMIRRDAANTLALRNSTNAQIFNIYNTYTDALNYERISIQGNSGSAYTISSQALGSGVIRNIALMGVSVGIGITSPTSKLTISGGDLEMDNNTSIKVSSSTANTTLLVGNYADGLAFSYGTSTNANNKTVNLAVEGDVKANRFCIGEDCKNTWTDIVTAGGGVKVVFVGVTTSAYYGNNVVYTTGYSTSTGYMAANDICNHDIAGSHVCTTNEILNTIYTKSLMPSSGIVWIFNGPPGYTTEANDCDGRTSNRATSFGAVWQTDIAKWPNGRGMLTKCNNYNQFACCK